MDDFKGFCHAAILVAVILAVMFCYEASLPIKEKTVASKFIHQYTTLVTNGDTWMPMTETEFCVRSTDGFKTVVSAEDYEGIEKGQTIASKHWH